MTIYEFGDVILVPFPFTDQTGSKKRPAVVIGSRACQADHPDVIVMAITSQAMPGKAVGEATISNWRRAGLQAPSVTKPLIASLDRGLVIRKLGRLTDKDVAAVHDALGDILG